MVVKPAWSQNACNRAPSPCGLARLSTAKRNCAKDGQEDESYIAPGYGMPSPGGREALHLLATTEAILLDHVYTAKALAALIGDVRAGKYRPGSTLVFLHTGGVPAIFAEPETVLSQNR